MKRLKLIAVSFLSSLLAIALPVSVAYMYGQRRANQAQETFLTQNSRSGLDRTERTYDDAVAGLREVEASHWSSCSPAHIEAMRLSTFNHLSISEIGFINRDNFLACTSWGVVNRAVRHGAYTFVRRDGVGIHLAIKPMIVRGNTTIALNLGMHNALVDPARLLDVPEDKNLAIAIANEDGHVVSTLNRPPEDVVTYAIRHPESGILGQYFYASYRRNGWIAVAVEDRHLVRAESIHQEKVLIPLALLVSAFLVTGIGLVIRRRLSPLAELRIAVQNREFLPYYQPIMNLATRKCVGAEALVRWRFPDGHIATPNFFLPLAEESGLIEPISDQLIEQVLDDMESAIRTDPSLHITINLSCKDIETGRLLSLLATLLEERHLPASCIWLEATERGFINANAARATLERARHQGHVVAIDDFGTGYSSLSLLHSLPLDVLKIDKAFVEAIATGSATSTVIDNIIDIATGLELDIIAEGIETEEQAMYLRSRNVVYGQGYLYAKPMPRDEFLTFYRRQKDD